MRGQIPIKNWYFSTIIWCFKYSEVCLNRMNSWDSWPVLCPVLYGVFKIFQPISVLTDNMQTNNFFFRSHRSVKLLKLFSIKVFFQFYLYRFRSNLFNLLIIGRCQIPAGSECSCMAFLSIFFELKFYYLFECYLM